MLDEYVTDTGLSRPKFMSLLILTGAQQLAESLQEIKMSKPKMKQLIKNLVTEEPPREAKP